MLLILFIASFLIMMTVNKLDVIVTQVNEIIFFKHFEAMYKETQAFSLTQQEELVLSIAHHEVKNNYSTVTFPKSISNDEDTMITFNKKGGNSSLKTIVFHTSSSDISYQLYLGSGKFKKTKR